MMKTGSGYLANLRTAFVAAMLLLPLAAARAEAEDCANPLALAATAMPDLDLTAEETAAIGRFYVARDNRCAWNLQSATTLKAVLARASEQGLDPDRYHADAIRARDTQDATSRDLTATAMALRYAYDMTMGRIDLTSVDDDTAIPVPSIDPAASLADAMEHGTLDNWLARLEPSDPAYRKLVTALAFYREVAGRGGWAPIAPGPTLDIGQSDPRVSSLKRRLSAEGYLPARISGHLFDQATKAALQSFQRRHGLVADGRLGGRTIAALNVPLDERLNQIEANLERRRILDRALPTSGVTVNAPAATATLTEDGQPILSMRAIVGDWQHPTPMLVSTIDTIVINPPWIIPRSIIRHEIEPALRRDPQYLEHNRMRWIGDQLVQAPGPRNSLGQIKFELPNRFSVYMHDTSTRALFAQDMRARSHGCVRLERPLDLALELLKADTNWSHDKLVSKIDEGKTTRVRLPTPVPVAFVYWTVFVDDDGALEFRDDLYGRDARLMDALRGRPTAPIKSAQAEICCNAG
ncbi:MAG TPA: L,D-transpeptidase family protein [Alphaproteobacteria bacterium]|nr:L,D-transpeptidase family protein [Alphaproteobacteria bacterium]